MKTKRKIKLIGVLPAIIMALSASVVCYAALTAYSHLAEPKVNRFTFYMGESLTVGIEEYLKYDAGGRISQGSDDTKVVSVTNPDTSTADAVIRVLIVPVVYGISDGAVAEAAFDGIGNGPVAGSPEWTVGDLTVYMADDWSLYWFFRDGFFYCSDVIPPGVTTAPLIRGVALADGGGYAGKELTLEIFADGIDAGRMSEWGLALSGGKAVTE